MYWLIVYMYPGGSEKHKYYNEIWAGPISGWVEENYNAGYILVNAIKITEQEYDGLLNVL